MLYMLCCIKSQPLAVFDLSVFYFLFSFWSIHTQLIKFNLCGGFFFLFPQSISLDSRSLMSDEVEGGVFCSSWYASEASFFFFDDQEFFTISDLLLPFLSTRTCSDYDVQTNPFTHQKNAMPSLSLFYFPLPFSPFIIISLLKLLLLRKHYLSFFLSSDLDTAQGAVNLICFMMVVITFL